MWMSVKRSITAGLFVTLVVLAVTGAAAVDVTISQAAINSGALTLLAACLTFVASLYWFKRKEHAALVKRVGDLEMQLASVSSQVVPISAAFQAMIVRDLTHAHTPELDELMSKIGPPSLLDDAQQARMLALLDERMNNLGALVPESEREKARILPFVMKMAQDEARALLHPAVVQFVAVPSDVLAPAVITPQIPAKKA